jgi:MFS family permease
VLQDAAAQGVFAALRVRGYRVYWTTGLVSNTGTAMQGVALDWLVLTVSHSGTAVGWTAGLQFAPVLLFGLWGGVLADRRDRRTVLLVAQSLYALQALVLAVAVLSGHAPLWLLYALAFCLGCVFTVENPARLSFVTELVGGRLIPNAAGLNILSLNVARLVGPALAGVLIGAVGTGWVFALNACCRSGRRPGRGPRRARPGRGRAGTVCATSPSAPTCWASSRCSGSPRPSR